jgi:hypothetical protein
MYLLEAALKHPVFSVFRSQSYSPPAPLFFEKREQKREETFFPYPLSAAGEERVDKRSGVRVS